MTKEGTLPPSQDGEAAFTSRNERDAMSKDDFIPAGFVPLAQWDYRSRGKADGHSPEYKELRVAVDAGKVRAIRVGGSNRWYVRESDAVAFLNARASEPQQPAKPAANGSQIDAAVVALCEINNGIAVLGDTLRNLVAAVDVLREQQAKQHEPVGTWRDMNGEVMN